MDNVSIDGRGFFFLAPALQIEKEIENKSHNEIFTKQSHDQRKKTGKSLIMANNLNIYFYYVLA